MRRTGNDALPDRVAQRTRAHIRDTPKQRIPLLLGQPGQMLLQRAGHRPAPDRARNAPADAGPDLRPQQHERSDHRDVRVRDGRLRADAGADRRETTAHALQDLRPYELGVGPVCAA